MRARGMLWAGLGAVALIAMACGTDDVIFDTTGGAGPGGSGSGASTSTSTSSQSGGQGGVGGSVMCTNDDECAIDSLCAVGICDNGFCGSTPEPAGTSCGPNGEECNGMGNCLLGDGAVCTSATECTSGFCADGVCCESDCTGKCVACNLTGSEGTCTPHPAGTDPDNDCMGGVCDGGGACAMGTGLWAKSFGNSSAQYGSDVAVDGAGNVYVTGFFDGAIDFGGGALTSAGGSDIFLAKFDTNGNHLWSKRFGSTTDDEAWRVATDSGNNVIIVGSFHGSVDFGGGLLNSLGSFDVVVAKYDASGNHVWSQRYGNNTQQFGRALAVGPNDEVAVGGYFTGSLDMGGGALTSAGNYDAFVGVLSSGGVHQWSARYGDANNDLGYGVAFDSTGGLFMTGAFQGAIDLGGGSLNSFGGYDIFLAHLTSTGTHDWSQRFGNGSDQASREVEVDSGGNVVLGCFFAGAVDFGGGAIVSGGNDDPCIAKFTSSGSHVFSMGFSGTADEGVRGMAIDSADNIILSGYASGDIDLGGGVLSSGSGYDAYLAKYTSAGVHVWSNLYGTGNGWQVGYGVDTNATNQIFAVGYFEASIDFGSGVLNSLGQEDVYLAKLSP